MMAAIQASLGQSERGRERQRGGRQTQAEEGVPPATASRGGTEESAREGERATLEAIEMGFAPERVKRLQSERQRSTGTTVLSRSPPPLPPVGLSDCLIDGGRRLAIPKHAGAAGGNHVRTGVAARV